MLYDCLFLDKLNYIDTSWSNFLSQENVNLLKNIEKSIISQYAEYTPAAHNALRFFNLPLHQIKILILGQDPYPQSGVATGRAFEVGTLKSWDNAFNNISLKNIIRSIYHAYKGTYLKYSEIKKEIGLYFPLKSPDVLFKHWEKQGVLLLNTSFTCKIGEPNSHEKIWQPFTQRLLKFIAGENKDIVWFIWGNNAKSVIQGIDIKQKIESMHPMMCYNKDGRDDDFLFGKVNPFYETKSLINWLG